MDNTIVVAVAKADTRKSRLVDLVLLSDSDALSINSAVREDVDVDGDVDGDVDVVQQQP